MKDENPETRFWFSINSELNCTNSSEILRLLAAAKFSQKKSSTADEEQSHRRRLWHWSDGTTDGRRANTTRTPHRQPVQAQRLRPAQHRKLNKKQISTEQPRNFFGAVSRTHNASIDYKSFAVAFVAKKLFTVSERL